MATRILIYNPSYGKGFVRCARSAFRSAGRVQRHPDYLLYATALLEREGYECKFIDGAALDMTVEDFRQVARDFKPDMAVVHTTTPSIYSDIKNAELLKEEAGCKMVLVGPHASAMPEDMLRLSEKVDAIAKKEFDYTLLDLAEMTEGKKSMRDILGITYREGGHVASTAERPFIENLDGLPFPAWHHVDPHWYFDPVKRNPFLTLISGRGCPFKCSFCLLPQTLMGRRYRLRSPKNVVDEMESDFSQFPYLKGIMFEDDTILVDRKRCRDICSEIIDRRIDTWWGCNVRADVTDLELLRHMRKAGCQLFIVGYESGSQQVLNTIRKGISVDMAKDFTRLARKAGIHVHGCFILGLPGETRDTLGQTVQYIRELKPDTIQVYAATPYPGTEFYDWAEKQGFITAKRWDDYVSEEHEQTCVVSYPDLPDEEILMYVNEAYQNFYLSPRNAINLVLKIRGVNDISRFLRGFINFLGYWRTYGRKMSHSKENHE